MASRGFIYTAYVQKYHKVNQHFFIMILIYFAVKHVNTKKNSIYRGVHSNSETSQIDICV